MLLAVDIVGFNAPQRNDQARGHIHQQLYQYLRSALRESAITEDAGYCEDRGDGLIIVFAPTVDLAADLEPLLIRLRAGLHRHNRLSSMAAQIRLRTAAHLGVVGHDGHGLTGSAVSHVFRLLDSPPIRKIAAQQEAVLSLIVSDLVYTSLVQSDASLTIPEDFLSVRAQIKETDAAGWLRVPGWSPDTLAVALTSPTSTSPRVTSSPASRDSLMFSGRTTTLAELDAISAGRVEAAPVALLVGLAGVGKTTTAIRWANRMTAVFPDGQVYINLGGQSPEALTVDTALVQMLRSIGIDESNIPSSVDARGRLWRAQTATRRLLLVLDDAADVEQVRRLLPEAPGCMTVITSRYTLDDLITEVGAKVIRISPMSSEEAIEFVRSIVGDERITAEPEAVEELVQRCRCLPLAIWIAAAAIANQPGRSIADMIDDVTDTAPPDAPADEDDPAAPVIAAFNSAYEDLDELSRRALRRLGLVPGPSFTAAVVTYLLPVSQRVAAQILGDLGRAHLVQLAYGDQYYLHDLIAHYCRERLAAEETRGTQDTVFRAMIDGYVSTAIWHRRRLGRFGRWLGGEAGAADLDASARGDANAWFGAEWRNLAATARVAHAAGMWEATGQLADALFDPLDLRRHLHENVKLQELAADAARATANTRLSALCELRLARLHRESGEYAEALDHAERAHRLSEDLGNRALESDAACVEGTIRWRTGDYDLSFRCAGRALDLARLCGDASAEAAALNLLAQTERRRGDYESAYQDAQAALGIWQDVGDTENEAIGLYSVARLLPRIPGRDMDALSAQERALVIFRQNGDRRGAADALDGLARIEQRLGRLDTAIQHAEEARALRRDIGDRRGETVSLDTLAHLCRAIGDRDHASYRYAEARTYATDGLDIARETDDSYGEAALLSNYARILLSLGMLEEAQEAAERSVHIGAALDDPYGQARRRRNLAKVVRALEQIREGADGLGADPGTTRDDHPSSTAE